jgi:hypothetical protein
LVGFKRLELMGLSEILPLDGDLYPIADDFFWKLVAGSERELIAYY